MSGGLVTQLGLLHAPRGDDRLALTELLEIGAGWALARDRLRRADLLRRVDALLDAQVRVRIAAVARLRAGRADLVERGVRMHGGVRGDAHDSVEHLVLLVDP